MGISFLGSSGDKINQTTVNTTTNTDSYNQTFSRTDAFSNVGNTTLSLGAGAPASGLSGMVANLGPYLIAGAFIYAGLKLLNKGKA